MTDAEEEEDQRYTEAYECHLCHKNFSSLNTVHTHIRTMHSNIEYNCVYCVRTRRRRTKNYTVLEPKPGVKESAQHMKLCNICGAVVQQACTHLSNTNFPKEFCCTLCEAVFKHRETYESHVMELEHGK
ncbi:hypothetical protein quinque_002818 [Culex quinquefasciatus]